ncbi:MAG TPA: ABC transporter permease [Gemmatimonadaceae bacterium]|nr:ABC transporter permease [Gemmatimonadaceae bacterium]
METPTMIETLLKDLKHAVRMFRKSPGFTFAAVAALALGIGANTAIFSVVDAVLLKPLPFPAPARMVLFGVKAPRGRSVTASPAEFEFWRRQTAVVQDVAAFKSGFINYTGGAFPEQLRSAQVSAAFFRLFGARTVLGRTFTEQEDLPNAGRFVVISKPLWQQRFRGDPHIVGTSISLGGDPYTVIGVLDDFSLSDLGGTPDVLVPWQFDPNTTDQGHYFLVGGRLKPGVTLDQANAELQHATAEYRAVFPRGVAPTNSFFAEKIGEVLVANARKSLYVLLGAVGFVLLIACANVANLLLAQAAARTREIAIRTALGGSRGRIIRQLLTESILLSLVGGALGLVLGAIGIRALLSVNTAGLPRVGQHGAMVGIDWRVLGFTLAVSIGTGILFGLLPALTSARADLAAMFKEGSARSGSGFRQNKARSVLIVTEVALAIVLLVGSALLIRTTIALSHVDPGFDVHNVLTMRMSFTGQRFATSASVEQAVREGVQRVMTVPGVEVASATCCVPLEGGYGLPFTIAGRPATNGPYNGGGGWMTVSPGYFDVFKIPVKQGRAFTDRDDGQATPVVIINEAMAKQYWPKGGAIGAHITIGRGVMKQLANAPERQIIGVVGDSRDGGLNNDPQPQMFVPQAQVPDALNALNETLGPMAWVVRTRTAPIPLSKAIEEQLRQATGLPVSNMESMEQVVQTSTSRQRFNMWLMTVFGASALVLAAIGIYGLMAYSVEQRAPEIGIRLALGADGARVKNMIVVQGMRLALVGVVVGVAASFGLARLISSFLFGVAPWDPLVFVSVPVLLILVALVAVWWPARRASRVDPLSALRSA